MNEELISVIVPVHNVEEYLDGCVSTLLNQTYKAIEIILVDDGSTDCSRIKCDDYAKNKNVIVLHKKNEGISSARNAGIEIAKGKYISFVDSDDYVDIHLLAELYNLIKKYNVLMSSVRHDLVGEDPGYELPPDNKTEELLSAEELLTTQVLGIDCKKRLCTYSVWGKLFDVKLINKIRFCETVNYAEDAIFNTEAIINAGKIAYSNKCLYHYRIRKNSLSNNNSLSVRRIEDKLLSEDCQIAMLEKANFDDIVTLKRIKLCDDLTRELLSGKNNSIYYLLNRSIKQFQVSILEILRSSYSAKKKIKLLIIRFAYYFSPLLNVNRKCHD